MSSKYRYISTQQNAFMYVNQLFDFNKGSYFIHISLVFPYCSFSVRFRVQSRTLHYIQSSCLYRLFQIVIVFQKILIFDDLDNSEEHQSDIAWNVPQMGFVSWFPNNQTEFWVWGRKTTEEKCYFHLIISRGHTYHKLCYP